MTTKIHIRKRDGRWYAHWLCWGIPYIVGADTPQDAFDEAMREICFGTG